MYSGGASDALKRDDSMAKPIPPTGEIVLYQTDDGRSRVECRLANETLWLSQILIADLFQVSVPTVNEHLKNIYQEGELKAAPTIRKFRIVQQEGKRTIEREIEHYSLDAILAVGYRVRSDRGIQFRRWATERLHEYLVKGFSMDDQRLKNPPIEGSGTPDYFDELLERIRDIRASEKRMYLRVREIFALAGDYDPAKQACITFFQTIQNRLHFAATGKTAPELIAERADHSLPNMGLKSWQGAIVRKGDVTVAKNYLNQDEIGELNRIVVMWLDYAEDQARRRKQIFLKDWESKLNEFLRFNERSILDGKGKISKTDADAQAEKEYQAFETRRRELRETEAEKAGQKQREDFSNRLSNKTKPKNDL